MRKFTLFAELACLLAALVLPIAIPTHPAAAQGFVPTLEPVDCPVDFPARYEVRCGMLTVPELHADPTGRTIQLMVAIFETRYRVKRADPVLFLSGGPGTNTLDSFAYGLGGTLDVLLRKRAVILLDQRGMGYSQPNLSCPEWDARAIAAAGAESLPLSVAALTACRDRLQAQGVNIAAFNTVESAGDIETLRIALGGEPLNIITGSYGSTLALTAMRHTPAAIRSAVLAATTPPETDLIPGFATNFQRAADLFFAHCEDDLDCAGSYSNVDGLFYQLMLNLSEQPEDIEIALPDGSSTVPLRLDGSTLFSGMQRALYAGYDPQIAGFLYALAFKQYQAIAPLALATIDSDTVIGALYAFRCADDVYSTTPAALDAAIAEIHPVMQVPVSSALHGYFDLCAIWPAAHLDPIESTPVTGPVPALFLQGDFDPTTSPVAVESAARALDHAYVIGFPDAGHMILDAVPCGAELIEAFVEDPSTAPETSCVAR